VSGPVVCSAHGAREKLTALKNRVRSDYSRSGEGSVRVVRLSTTARGANADLPLPGVARVQADRFFAAYEVELAARRTANPTCCRSGHRQSKGRRHSTPTATGERDLPRQNRRGAREGSLTRRRVRLISKPVPHSHKYQVNCKAYASRFRPQEFRFADDQGNRCRPVGEFVRMENGRGGASTPESGKLSDANHARYFPRKQGQRSI